MCVCFLNTSLLSSITRCTRLVLFPTPDLESAISPQSPVLSLENGIRFQDLGTRYAYCYCSVISYTLSAAKQNIWVHATCVYIYTYILLRETSVSLLSWTWVCTGIAHYHMDHSTFLPLLSYKFLFQQWETWLSPFAIHLISCFTSGYIYSSVKVVNMCPCREWLY